MSRLSIGIFAPMNMSRFAGDSVRIVELANGLRTAGADVSFIIPAGGDKTVSSRFKPHQTYWIPEFKHPALRYATLSFFSQFFVPNPVVDSINDIVQIESAYVFPLSKLRRIAQKKNIVFDMHSIAAIDLEPYLPNGLKLPITSVLHSAQDYLLHNSQCLVVSNSMVNYIHNRLKKPLKNVNVVPNGVNLELAEKAITEIRPQYEYLKEGTELLLVYVGGLEWYEGVDIAIKALPKLKEHIPQLHLVIAGRGTEEVTLRRLCIELGLKKDVTFLGWVPYEDTFALQSISDVLIAPRKPLQKNRIDISTPMKIPSYLSAGSPIVASKIGEIPYVARHMKESILIEQISPDSFVEAINILWNDSSLIEKMSSNCLNRAREYSWKNIGSNLLELYESLAD